MNQYLYQPKAYQRVLACLYGLSVFSYIYSLTNQYTAVLSQQEIIPTVANLYTKIDNHIMFIDWMILPYACSLPLFIASFFMVKTKLQLQNLLHRLLLTTLLAGLVFFYFPLQFSFDVSPHLSNSIWAEAYQILYQFDKPYNQLPSLHVAYGIILVVSLWSSICSILARVLLLTLGLLIIISTLFTWQHHLLDILAGILLAIVVLVNHQYLEKKQSTVTKASLLKYCVIAVVGFLSIAILPVLMNIQCLAFKIFAYYWLVSFIGLVCVYHRHRADFLLTPHAHTHPSHQFIRYAYFAPIFTVYWFMWKVASYIHLVQIPNKAQRVSFQLSNQSIHMLATGKARRFPTHKQSPLYAGYDDIIWLNLASELTVHNSIYSAKKGHENGYHYLITPMLDVVNWNEQEYGTIVHYCRRLDEVISAKNANAKVLIVTQCVMGWSRSVCMLACILAYYGYSDEYIKNCISKQYPKSHIWQILDIALLEKLRNSD